jgi:hypothetical protein
MTWSLQRLIDVRAASVLEAGVRARDYARLCYCPASR